MTAQPFPPCSCSSPFGHDADRCLSLVHPHLDDITEKFLGMLEAEMAEHTDLKEILNSLSASELIFARAYQKKHLHHIFSAAVTPLTLTAWAKRMGRTLSLIGAPPSWITHRMSIYWEIFRTFLNSLDLDALQKHNIMRISAARLLLDTETQLDAAQNVMDDYHRVTAQQAIPSNISGSLTPACLTTLPGILSCHLIIPSYQGMFLVNDGAGAYAASLGKLLSAVESPPSLDQRSPLGRGMISTAWYSGNIQISHAYQKEPHMQPWRTSTGQRGIHSAVALPIRRNHEIDFILLLTGRYPHQFSARWMQTFLLSLQNRWHAPLLPSSPPSPSTDSPSKNGLYRRLLYTNSLRMFYQPVVDLHTGTVVKVEALARLVDNQEKLITPDLFLENMSYSDLTSLFLNGLEQAFQFLARSRAQGKNWELAINLPPCVLIQPKCAEWISDILCRYHFSPSVLTLELLENQEFDSLKSHDAMHVLSDLGIKLAIDDLGSGYSSLRRFHDYPFDIIKVDKSITLNIPTSPIKTLKLIHTLIRIGTDFDLMIIAEGLESKSIIEAVVQLGSRFGQGYGLSHPLAEEAMLGFTTQHFTPFSTGHGIHSTLGALAYHWRHIQSHGDPFQILPERVQPLRNFLAQQSLNVDEPQRLLDKLLQATNLTDYHQPCQALQCWLLTLLQKNP